MKGMRNVLLGLLLTCLLLAPSANAQGLLRALHLKPTPYHTHFSAKKMTQLLEQRAAQSYQQALQATSLPQMWDKPCTRIAPALENPQQIYPHMERFLTTRQQWDNYILSSYNRRIQTYSTRLEQFLKQLTDRFYELYFAQHVVRVPQEQAMARLALQVPADTQYLLVGETHTDFIMEPYSLAKQFNGAHPFVVLLEGPTQPSDFDIMSNGAFPDRVLRFTDKKLSRIAGFDIQLRATADNIPFSTGDRPLNAR